MIAFASVENAVLFSAAVQEALVKSKVRVCQPHAYLSCCVSSSTADVRLPCCSGMAP
jgi:hypothetical protein